MNPGPLDLWPAESVAAALRNLNREFLRQSPVEFLRGRDNWPNQQPERFAEELADAQRHGVIPLSPLDSDFELLMKGGKRFNWAVLLDGSLRVTPSLVVGEAGPARISHAILSPDGGAVLAAGEGKVDAFLSNTTGHYKNEAFVVPPVKQGFAALGIYFKR